MSFYEDRLVLVTGGTGFVGSHFVEELLAAKARVRVPLHQRPMRIRHHAIECMDLDLRVEKDCLAACAGVDYVIHAAGAVAGVGLAGTDPVMAGISTNLTLTCNVLQAAAASGVGRFLLFSSSTGYPAYRHAVKEDEFWSGPVHDSYFGYGWMRRYLERLGEFVHRSSPMRVAIARPTAVYGRHDDFNPKTSHVVPALIRRAVAGENPFVVWGTPDVVRDMLHISDFVKGCLLLLERHANCDPVNIGSGKELSMQKLVEIVLGACGNSHFEVKFDASRPVSIPFRLADITKAQSLLGFAPSVRLEAGIKDALDWYRNTK